MCFRTHRNSALIDVTPALLQEFDPGALAPEEPNKASL
jgi:hypothetical protein